MIVVEGFFDSFAVHQAGYPAVGALMGSTLSAYQADLLRGHFDRIVLILDGDAAGRQGTAGIMKMLAHQVPVSVVALTNGAQPDQLTARQIGHLVDQSQVEARDGRAVPSIHGTADDD